MTAHSRALLTAICSLCCLLPARPLAQTEFIPAWTHTVQQGAALYLIQSGYQHAENRQRLITQLHRFIRSTTTTQSLSYSGSYTLAGHLASGSEQTPWLFEIPVPAPSHTDSQGGASPDRLLLVATDWPAAQPLHRIYLLSLSAPGSDHRLQLLDQLPNDAFPDWPGVRGEVLASVRLIHPPQVTQALQASQTAQPWPGLELRHHSPRLPVDTITIRHDRLVPEPFP